jgi:hypothetical protein
MRSVNRHGLEMRDRCIIGHILVGIPSLTFTSIWGLYNKEKRNSRKSPSSIIIIVVILIKELRRGPR